MRLRSRVLQGFESSRSPSMMAVTLQSYMQRSRQVFSMSQGAMGMPKICITSRLVRLLSEADWPAATSRLVMGEQTCSLQIDTSASRSMVIFSIGSLDSEMVFRSSLSCWRTSTPEKERMQCSLTSACRLIWITSSRPPLRSLETLCRWLAVGHYSRQEGANEKAHRRVLSLRLPRLGTGLSPGGVSD